MINQQGSGFPLPCFAKCAEEGKKRRVCSVCGYVYGGETLPDDFICPLCKHGKEDFELVEA